MDRGAFSQLHYAGRLKAAAGAVCLTGRDIADCKVLLYQLSDFYVDVYYRKVYHFISRIHAFGPTEAQDPYLEKMPVAF